MAISELKKTDATTVRRKTERADYRRESANAILDEALVAHVGFVVDDQPFVIPMAYGRDDHRVILHGSVASRLLRTLKAGVNVCVTVTLIDAIVLARSQFHTSMNYRSVVVVGTAREITDPADKRKAMEDRRSVSPVPSTAKTGLQKKERVLDVSVLGGSPVRRRPGSKTRRPARLGGRSAQVLRR